MRFYVRDRSETLRPTSFPHVVLIRDNWDDWAFRTMFTATLVLNSGTSHPLGNVKILRKGQQEGYTEVDSRFTELSDAYCSLGQDSEYYEILRELPTNVSRTYLTAMRDAAFDKNIEDEFHTQPGWRTSLLRFGQAENALAEGRRMFEGRLGTPGIMSFTFRNRRNETEIFTEFAFDGTGELPGRCYVLIGYNGVGKTTLLADLAVAASRVGTRKGTHLDAALLGNDTTFGAVVAVSYSAFDTFVTPDIYSNARSNDTETFGYVYCGLRKFGPSEVDGQDPHSFRLKSIDELEVEFANALEVAGQRGEERNYLLRALTVLNQEPSFGRAGVDLEGLAQGAGTSHAIADFRALSTGHKIVLNIVTQLAAHLKRRSLLLFDEPETHLHPPLMAALLKAVQILLEAHDSFAIIATHSPVVVQEVPAAFVRVMERFGEDIEIENASIETFGESIGAITRHIFSLDSSATDFQGILRTLAESLTLDEIESYFPRGLSVQARALILNYVNEAL